MPGFDIKRFTDLIERESNHLICSICLNIYDNAIRTECEHNFCKICVQQWIETNGNECPECRQQFVTRKRTNNKRNDNNLVIIGNFVFKRNLLINNLINEMKIKCDFDFNGCKQTIKLSQLSAHIKECEHRLCPMCGLTFGNTEEHHCFELLRKNINDWKEKYEKQLEINNKLKEENSKNETKLQTNEKTIKELKQSYDNSVKNQNQWKEKYENQMKINNNLKEENSENKTKLQTNGKIIEELKQKYDESVKDMNELKDNISNLKKEFQSKENENKELNKQLSENSDSFKNEIKSIIRKTLEKIPDFCDSSPPFSPDFKEEVLQYLSGLSLIAKNFLSSNLYI